MKIAVARCWLRTYPGLLSLGAVARAVRSMYLMVLMVVALLELILVRGGMKR